MKKLNFFAVCALFPLANAFSPEIKPAATPPLDDYPVKIPTTLIQIDVSVTDDKGRIIDDLTAKDFEVYENGVRQNITTFSFVSNVRAKNETNKETKNNPAVPVPTAQISPEQVRRTFALVVDDLVAIIRTGAGIGAVDLGSRTPSGDYILQIVVIDNLAKEKRKIATQFVQFEIVE